MTHESLFKKFLRKITVLEKTVVTIKEQVYGKKNLNPRKEYPFSFGLRPPAPDEVIVNSPAISFDSQWPSR